MWLMSAPGLVCIYLFFLVPLVTLLKIALSERTERGSSKVDFSWAFVVRAHESGRGSRLLVRERYRARGAGGGYAVQAAAAASTPMTLSMLRGIRGRAETLVHSGV